jgi:hypothetical protein
MSDELNPAPLPNPGETNSSGMTILWLIVALVPSFVAIPLFNNPSPQIGGWLFLFLLTGGCCIFAAFGVLRRMKDPILRIVLALLVAGLFFVLNVFIVLLIGCSGMGRIAP